MKNKKITILALVLLIIAGIVVVGLKGFNVDFMLKQHDSVEYRIEKEFEVSDVENMAKEVFGDKKFKIKVIELFGDAVSIHSENITTDEADNLIKKLDEKYKPEATEKTNYTITSNPKVKLVSLVKPYLVPSIIAGVIISCYMAIRYKKIGALKVVMKMIAVILISVVAALSILAIIRFPINTYVMPGIMLIVTLEMVAFCMKNEKELEKFKEE